MLNKTCEKCKKTFKVHRHRREKARFCSRECYIENSNVVLVCKTCSKKFTRKSYLVRSQDTFCSHECQTKDRLHEGHPDYANNKGENSYAWKGARVGYVGLHQWVRRNLKRPKACEHCGTKEAKKYEWANVDGRYRRNLKDWINLCRSCHVLYDRNNGMWGGSLNAFK